MTIVLYGMIGLLGAKIWVENRVDFGQPDQPGAGWPPASSSASATYAEDHRQVHPRRHRAWAPSWRSSATTCSACVGELRRTGHTTRRTSTPASALDARTTPRHAPRRGTASDARRTQPIAALTTAGRRRLPQPDATGSPREALALRLRRAGVDVDEALEVLAAGGDDAQGARRRAEPAADAEHAPGRARPTSSTSTGCTSWPTCGSRTAACGSARSPGTPTSSVGERRSTRCRCCARRSQLVAHPVIRNRGTTVGSIAHADPSGEMTAVLALTGGSVEVAAPGPARPCRRPTSSSARSSPRCAGRAGRVSASFPAFPAGTGIDLRRGRPAARRLRRLRARRRGDARRRRRGDARPGRPTSPSPRRRWCSTSRGGRRRGRPRDADWSAAGELARPQVDRRRTSTPPPTTGATWCGVLTGAGAGRGRRAGAA